MPLSLDRVVLYIQHNFTGSDTNPCPTHVKLICSLLSNNAKTINTLTDLTLKSVLSFKITYVICV